MIGLHLLRRFLYTGTPLPPTSITLPNFLDIGWAKNDPGKDAHFVMHSHPLSPGTGYGTGRTAGASVWDAQAGKTMQEAQDAELQQLMQRLGRLLTSALPRSGNSTAASHISTGCESGPTLISY